MKKALIIIFFLLVASATSVWLYNSRKKNNTVTWKTAVVDTGSVSVNVTATGSLNAVTTVQVGAQVSGKVSMLFADFNSVVRKGQVIAMLDTILLYANMRDAAARLQRAIIQADLAGKQFTRTDTLFRQKVAAQSDHDLAYSNYKSAEADVIAAKAVLDHEKTNLRYATIKAPINGTVISRNVDVGQTVISSFNAPTLFTIANDLTRMQVLANVDEADIGQVKVGQETIFTVDAYPYETFKGTVAQIRLQPVVVQNVNNYIVVINVPNSDLKLLPGLTANITIKILEHHGVVKVPSNAIHFMPSADYMRSIKLGADAIDTIQSKKIANNEMPAPGAACFVWVRNRDVLSPRKVTVGLFDGTFMEIAGDVKKGEEIVIGNGASQANANTANNPFMPKMPPRRAMR